MYDLLQHSYTDAILVGQRKANERNSLCDMVDRSSLKNVLIIADRGYEAFNLMAHIQEKDWFFLIRIQDVLTSKGIAAGLDLPNTEEFDCLLTYRLQQSKQMRSRLWQKTEINTESLLPAQTLTIYLLQTESAIRPLSTSFLFVSFGSKLPMVFLKQLLPTLIPGSSLRTS